MKRRTLWLARCAMAALLAALPLAASAQRGDPTLAHPVVWPKAGLIFQTSPETGVWNGWPEPHLHVPIGDPLAHFIFYLWTLDTAYSSHATKWVQGKYTMDDVRNLIKQHDADVEALLEAFPQSVRDAWHHVGGKDLTLDEPTKEKDEVAYKLVGFTTSNPEGLFMGPPGSWTITRMPTWYNANATKEAKQFFCDNSKGLYFAARFREWILHPFNVGKFSPEEYGNIFDFAGRLHLKPTDKDHPNEYLNNARNRFIHSKAFHATYTIR